MESDWLGKSRIMPQTRTCKEEKGQDSNLIRTGRKTAKTFIGAILNVRNQQKEPHCQFSATCRTINIAQQSIVYAQIVKNMRISVHNIPHIIHLIRPKEGAGGEMQYSVRIEGSQDRYALKYVRSYNTLCQDTRLLAENMLSSFSFECRVSY